MPEDTYMNESLVLLKDLVSDLRKDNSTSYKRSVLQKVTDPSVKDLVRLTYDTHTVFNLTIDAVGTDSTEEACLWDDPLPNWPPNKDPLDVFQMLSSREVTGDKAIETFKSARNALPENLREVFNLILERDLKAKVGFGLLSEAFPGLFDEFSVQLADKFSAKKLHTEYLYYSRKMDGVRMILTYVDGVATAFSRQGKKFLSVDKVIEDFIKSMPKSFSDESFILDGELCLVNANGDEDFQGIISVFRKKDYTIPNPRYTVFDILPYSQFLAGKGDKVYSERLKTLDRFFADSTFQHIKQIETKVCKKTDIPLLEKELDIAVGKGWEGLIVRNNTVYEGKRNDSLLKMKKFSDAEFTVLSTNNDMVDNGTGGKVLSLASVTIQLDDKGNTVGVGSGFTFEERMEFFHHPEKIIGKTITVKFFERTKDQNGKPSLRFPVYKGIREGGE